MASADPRTGVLDQLPAAARERLPPRGGSHSANNCDHIQIGVSYAVSRLPCPHEAATLRRKRFLDDVTMAASHWTFPPKRSRAWPKS